MQSGKLNNVNKLLNRKWSIDGKVQKGRQLGKKIGFPTANIDIKDYILAKPGVYVVNAKRQNESICSSVLRSISRELQKI